MRGWAQFDDRAGIGRETHSILLIKREDVEILREEPCLRCGWCLEACPHDLNPARLFEVCRLEDWGVARAYGLEECSECGACAWACPSHLKLVHGFRFAKKELEKRGEGRDRVPAS
jgi:electron transport complex protein RnfC